MSFKPLVVNNNNMQFLPVSTFFLAEASSKRFTYGNPWQTCYIRHLLNYPRSIHMFQGATGNLGTIAISVM